MSTQTTNYGLIKPTDNESADIAIVNQNMDTLDTSLKQVETTASALPAADTITDDMIGNRTPDASQVPATPGTGKVGQIVSWLANRIKDIMGGTNWWDAPATTLATANTHINTAAPHSGHALASALTAHTGLTTTAHGGLVASSDVVTVAAANKILKLDANSKLPASITGDAATVGGLPASTIEATARTNNTELRTEVLTADPAGATGRIYFNSTTKKLRAWDGAAWL